MKTRKNFVCARSNTCYVHPAVTPSAARQLNRKLHPHVGIKGCGDCTIVLGGGGSRY